MILTYEYIIRKKEPFVKRIKKVFGIKKKKAKKVKKIQINVYFFITLAYTIVRKEETL